jgi:hypothetical protein
VPDGQGSQAPAPDGTLTEKLKEGEGAITPPPVGDPDIIKRPPPSDSRIKVIPPPGEPGGDTDVQPK